MLVYFACILHLQSLCSALQDKNEPEQHTWGLHLQLSLVPIISFHCIRGQEEPQSRLPGPWKRDPWSTAAMPANTVLPCFQAVVTKECAQIV